MSPPTQYQIPRTTTSDLDSSNATLARFVGNAQKSWMCEAHTEDWRTPGATPKSLSKLSSRLNTAHQRSENVPPMGQRKQTIPDMAENGSISAPLFSPSERHTICTKNGNTRKASIQDSAVGNKRPRMDRSGTSEDLSLKSQSMASLPSPTPSLEKSGQGETSVALNLLSSQTSPTTIDLTASQTVPLQGLNRASCMECQLQTGVSHMAAPPVPATTQAQPLPSAVTENAAFSVGTSRATARENTGDLPCNTSAPDRSRTAATTSIEAGRPPIQVQANTSSGGSSPATSPNDFRKYHVRVTERLNRVSGQPGRSHIEILRLELLQQACDAGDMFFLVLHQLFCREHASRSLGRDLPGVEQGFQVVGRLLASNDDLTPDAIEWFSNSAMAPPSPEQNQIETLVLRFLATFAVRWTDLRRSFARYKIPHSSMVIVANLQGVDSVVLQQVIFRAILRTSWVEPQDECFGQCETVFVKNQQLVQEYLKDDHPDFRSNPAVLGGLALLAMQDLEKILVSHLAHSVDSQVLSNALENPPISIAPPHLEPNPAMSEDHRHHDTMATGIAGKVRPTLPNLDIQAAEQLYTAEQCEPREGTVFSSPSVVGPYSAPITGARRPSHAMPAHPPTTSAGTNGRTMSLPGPALQAPHFGTPSEQYLHRARTQQKQQQASGSQPTLPSGVPTTPNYMRTPIVQHFESGRPGPPEHQAIQVQQIAPMQQVSQLQRFAPMQYAPQVHQGTLVQMERQPQQATPRYQVSQMQQVPQTQRAPQTPQLAQIQQSPRMQQISCEGQGPSSNLQSIPLTSIIPSTQGNYVQQISTVRNAPGSRQMGHVQSFTAQKSPGHPQKPHFPLGTGGFALNHSAANMFIPPALFNATAFTVQPNRQIGASGPPRIPTADHFIWNSLASLPSMPNPVVTALHQAHAKTPQLDFWNPDNIHESVKAFRYIKNVFFHETLSNGMKSLQWFQEIVQNDFEKFAKDISGPTGLPFRQVSNGCYLARVRCIKLKGSDALPNESDWATSDVCWPPCVAVSVNGRFLEIRRKSHFGKDLPVDVTRMLKQGQNEFIGSVMGLPDDCTDQWLIGLEFVEVVDAASITAMLSVQTYPRCRDRILSNLRSIDPEIEVVHSQTVLDLTDPFTSRIFDMPVRGKNCTHHQCFDFDTFLETRGGSNKTEPCSAEDFKCPICKGDVRPHMMVVDGYLAQLRKELAKDGRLDAKAVILQEDGTWEIKVEEEKMGEEGDGSGKRPNYDLGGAAKTNMGSSTSKSKGKEEALMETIALDDD